MSAPDHYHPITSVPEEGSDLTFIEERLRRAGLTDAQIRPDLEDDEWVEVSLDQMSALLEEAPDSCEDFGRVRRQARYLASDPTGSPLSHSVLKVSDDDFSYCEFHTRACAEAWAEDPQVAIAPDSRPLREVDWIIGEANARIAESSLFPSDLTRLLRVFQLLSLGLSIYVPDSGLLAVGNEVDRSVDLFLYRPTLEDTAGFLPGPSTDAAQAPGVEFVASADFVSTETGDVSVDVVGLCQHLAYGQSVSSARDLVRVARVALSDDSIIATPAWARAAETAQPPRHRPGAPRL
jgi:hypothetical protein